MLYWKIYKYTKRYIVIYIHKPFKKRRLPGSLCLRHSAPRNTFLMCLLSFERVGYYTAALVRKTRSTGVSTATEISTRSVENGRSKHFRNGKLRIMCLYRNCSKGIIAKPSQILLNHCSHCYITGSLAVIRNIMNRCDFPNLARILLSCSFLISR